MKLLVNGSSISRGPNSWPYYLAESLNCELVNLACAGSGIDYTCDATIAELAQRDYDLVIIQWPTFNRWDHKVKHPEKYNTTYSSLYQSAQNDWPTKIVVPINDQDYVEKDWSFGCGYINNSETDPELSDLWESYYKSTSNQQMVGRMIIKIICLQSYLKQKNIPYLFFYNRPVPNLKEHAKLWEQIDYAHVYQEQYVLNIAHNENLWDTDGLHPNATAYKKFADFILPRVQELL